MGSLSIGSQHRKHFYPPDESLYYQTNKSKQIIISKDNNRPFKNKTLTKKHTSKGGSRCAKQALKGLRLGSLNVRGCNNLDKRERIERLMDERKLDVLALSETKLNGRREFRWEKVRDINNQGAKEGVAILE